MLLMVELRINLNLYLLLPEYSYDGRIHYLISREMRAILQGRRGSKEDKVVKDNFFLQIIVNTRAFVKELPWG